MIQIAGIKLFPYGLAVALAAFLCLMMCNILMRRRRLKGETAEILMLWALPLGFLCSRLVYCLICADGFAQKGIGYFFEFAKGGYAFWGAVLGCGLALWITGRMTHQSVGRIADSAAAPAAMMIAMCRFSMLLVGEGYGWYIEDWFDPDLGMSLLHPESFDGLLRFPFGVQDMYGEWCWAVFVLDGLLAVLIAALTMRSREKRPGITALRTLVMVAAAQIFCESLRQDAVLRFGFVRVSQLIGAVVIAAVLAYGCVKVRKGKGIAAPIAVLVVCIGVVVAMEFALEKKIVFLEAMPMDVCYAFTALACVVMSVTVCASLDKIAEE